MFGHEAMVPAVTDVLTEGRGTSPICRYRPDIASKWKVNQ